MSSSIKCRYTADVCEYGEEACPSCFEMAEYVDCGVKTNGKCEYAYHAKREFEKTVKSYELDECELKIGRKIIDTDDIEYLEIDGRVIYNEEKSCDDAH